MSKTKFMVIKLKELIKTVVFAVLGVIIIIGIIYFVLPKSQKTAQYQSGTYTAEINLGSQCIPLSVTVGRNSIQDISLGELPETIPVFYPLLQETAKEVGEKVIKKQDTDVSLSPDNIYTAQLVLEAISEGLAQAK